MDDTVYIETDKLIKTKPTFKLKHTQTAKFTKTYLVIYPATNETAIFISGLVNMGSSSSKLSESNERNCEYLFVWWCQAIIDSLHFRVTLNFTIILYQPTRCLLITNLTEALLGVCF